MQSDFYKTEVEDYQDRIPVDFDFAGVAGKKSLSRWQVGKLERFEETKVNHEDSLTPP